MTDKVYTKEELLAMDADQLEEVLLERVFGYRWLTIAYNDMQGNPLELKYASLVSPADYEWLKDSLPCVDGILDGAITTFLHTDVRYVTSTERDSVFEVVEHMRKHWRTDDPEETFWTFVDCQEVGWRVDINYSHHDGDITIDSINAPGLFPDNPLSSLAHGIYILAILWMQGYEEAVKGESPDFFNSGYGILAF